MNIYSDFPTAFLSAPVPTGKRLFFSQFHGGRKTAQFVILPEISKMKYRNWIPEPGTTISGIADNKKKQVTNLKMFAF
jgi:hypothetical protein